MDWAFSTFMIFVVQGSASIAQAIMATTHSSAMKNSGGMSRLPRSSTAISTTAAM
jgi:hypothetical protein